MTLRLSFSAVVVILTACGSMSGQVKDYSVDYGTAMAQFQNQQVLTNILRARDLHPLHFSELGQVNGSLQEQIQVGATVPFGKYVGAANATNSLAPQVQFTSSPTFTTSPLDTQAFTVGLMQPIDSSYLVDRWRSADADARKLLLLLFVESIENADTVPADSDLWGNSRLHNTPGNGREFAAFRAYINKLVDSKADFRLVTVLTPVGNAFDIGNDSSQYKLTDVIPLIDETAIHLRRTDDPKKEGGQFALWHLWPNQLALCYHPVNKKTASEPNPTTAQPEAPAEEIIVPDRHFDLFTNSLVLRGGSGKGNAGGGIGGGATVPAGPSGKGGGGGGGGSPAAQVATPVMPLVGFVPYGQCFGPIYDDHPQVKDRNGERQFQVNLRSVRGAIDYLGALLRSSDATIQSERQSIFSLLELNADNRNKARIITTYDGASYAVTDDTSAAVITILSELVDSLKLSSDIATTKQVQIIP